MRVGGGFPLVEVAEEGGKPGIVSFGHRGPGDRQVIDGSLRTVGGEDGPSEISEVESADLGMVTRCVVGFCDPVAVIGVPGGALYDLDLGEEPSVGGVVAGPGAEAVLELAPIWRTD